MTQWTVARQAPLSVGFSRQEYWSGLPCPSPGDLTSCFIQVFFLPVGVMFEDKLYLLLVVQFLACVPLFVTLWTAAS